MCHVTRGLLGNRKNVLHVIFFCSRTVSKVENQTSTELRSPSALNTDLETQDITYPRKGPVQQKPQTDKKKNREDIEGDAALEEWRLHQPWKSKQCAHPAGPLAKHLPNLRKDESETIKPSLRHSLQLPPPQPVNASSRGLLTLGNKPSTS